jgi:hypothetical protein
MYLVLVVVLIFNFSLGFSLSLVFSFVLICFVKSTMYLQGGPVSDAKSISV